MCVNHVKTYLKNRKTTKNPQNQTRIPNCHRNSSYYKNLIHSTLSHYQDQRIPLSRLVQQSGLSLKRQAFDVKSTERFHSFLIFVKALLINAGLKGLLYLLLREYKVVASRCNPSCNPYILQVFIVFRGIGKVKRILLTIFQCSLRFFFIFTLYI